jgi:signal transduction histidine kinase
VRDITERKAAEEKRSRLIRELESKNAEMERFTYTVSHDLKSPLITIRGFLGLLEKDLLAGHADRVRADLTHIHAAVASMQTLLAELLEPSRVGRIVNDPKIVCVHDLVDEALDRVIGLVAERGLAVDVVPSNLYVMGDQPRLIEVFQNLIENAAKFCGDDNPSPRLRIDFHAEGDDVVCEFHDNGVGIDPQFRDRVFVLFERLDPSSEGTGIGLALVKRVVELHGGSVWVESAGTGKGARFCVRLPRKGGDDDVGPQ